MLFVRCQWENGHISVLQRCFVVQQRQVHTPPCRCSLGSKPTLMRHMLLNMLCLPPVYTVSHCPLDAHLMWAYLLVAASTWCSRFSSDCSRAAPFSTARSDATCSHMG